MDEIKLYENKQICPAWNEEKEEMKDKSKNRARIEISADKIAIRAITGSDIDMIMELEAQSFNDEIMEEKSVFLDRISTCSTTNFALCDMDSRLLGSFFSEIWTGEPNDFEKVFKLGHTASELHKSDGETLYISSFAVNPKLRGARLIGFNKPAYYGGSGLSPARYFFNASIEKIIELHSQLRNIYLMVSDDWRSAQKIYEDGGFLRIHTFKRYDGFGDVPVHIYKKPLP